VDNRACCVTEEQPLIADDAILFNRGISEAEVVKLWLVIFVLAGYIQRSVYHSLGATKGQNSN